MTATYYFAYGSNMNPARVDGRRMRYSNHFAARLNDFSLAFNKRSVKFPGAASANVMVQPGAVTEGVCYQLQSADDIVTMDPFEGYPVRYTRQLLPVHADHGRVDAWVYIANPDYVVEGLQPARWYLQHLLAGEKFLSPGYLQRLAATTCLPESDVEPV